MDTIIEMVTGQETLFYKLIVVFWMLCVVLFYSTLIYGVGSILFKKRIKG